MKNKLSAEIGDYFDRYTGSELRYQLDEEELSYILKTKGFCSDKYASFEEALRCQINKRREKQCYNVHCESFGFCCAMRKEGYV